MTKRPDFDYRYSIIPGGAVTDPEVSMRDLQVLALLGRHTDKKGWCWRSQVEMALELRCGRATISRSIKRLVKAGWLEQKALPRGKTVLAEGEQPFSAFRYRVKVDQDDEADEANGDVPKNGHLHVDGSAANSKNGQEVPIAGGQGVPAQVGTHRRTLFKDPLNSLPPAGAGESEKVASLKEPEPERWPEFRSAVAKTWPDGFPVDNEVACRKQFEKLTTRHTADLLIACATLHGAELRKRQSARGVKSKQHAKLPGNWLREGDWAGYEPLAKAQAVKEAEIVTALGNIQRALGDGLFALLRGRMPDAELASLDGVTRSGHASFLVVRPFQRTLLDRRAALLERYLNEPPTFTMVASRRAS